MNNLLTALIGNLSHGPYAGISVRGCHYPWSKRNSNSIMSVKINGLKRREHLAIQPRM